jgi:hypothetical protein
VRLGQAGRWLSSYKSWFRWFVVPL